MLRHFDHGGVHIAADGAGPGLAALGCARGFPDDRPAAVAVAGCRNALRFHIFASRAGLRFRARISAGRRLGIRDDIVVAKCIDIAVHISGAARAGMCCITLSRAGRGRDNAVVLVRMRWIVMPEPVFFAVIFVCIIPYTRTIGIYMAPHNGRSFLRIIRSVPTILLKQNSVPAASFFDNGPMIPGCGNIAYLRRICKLKTTRIDVRLMMITGIQIVDCQPHRIPVKTRNERCTAIIRIRIISIKPICVIGINCNSIVGHAIDFCLSIDRNQCRECGHWQQAHDHHHCQSKAYYSFLHFILLFLFSFCIFSGNVFPQNDIHPPLTGATGSARQGSGPGSQRRQT